MWDLRAALEVSQTALGAVSCLYFAVGIQFKQAEARRRERTPFICFLIVMLFTVLVEQGILIVSAGGIPDLPPLAAAILYTLALILQIDHLCPCTAEDTNREPAWHVYFGSWAAMFVFDIVAIIKLALTARSLTLDLVCTSVAIGVRWCLGLALFATRLDRGGHIRLPDDVEYGTMGTDNSNDQGGGSSEPTKQSALRQSVRKEVDAAGGIWPWVKRFQIFLPWIWPSSAPRIKLRILTSLGLVLTTTGLELVMPRLYSVFVESLAQVYKDKDFSLIWPPLLVYTVTQSLLAGLSTLRSLVWSKVKIDRRRLASTSIHAHVMRHDARFHNQTNSTDINTAIDNGVIVCETFDFLVLQVVPQIITVIVAGTTIFSLFGPHVALVQASVIALDMIVVSRSTRVQMPIQDAKMIAHQEMKRRREGALKAWTTVALYGQIDREIDDFTTILQTETGLELKHLISWYGFQFSTSTMFTVGCFSATALAILYGLQAGGTFGPVVMFTNYWALLQTPLKFFTRIPGRLFQDLSTADRLRRLLADKPTMRYGTAAPRPVRDSIMLKNVSFSYPDSGKPIFKDLTLRILPKTTTAIVGPSAAGKTTIFNLLARQFDPDEGSIEVDHQDIRALQRGA
ncbi:hypothetical protein CEP51_009177 [Fusarium floridanum]|uniref:ABC transmembrane type-1 domain-containing protein n=1 Tax=Fusarium floridanum TaxID=1325733 RepID=A0A428RIK8_9HYPO|nr:hypothetical protein CEP51_009177 [Fusarium floridanum]